MAVIACATGSIDDIMPCNFSTTSFPEFIPQKIARFFGITMGNDDEKDDYDEKLIRLRMFTKVRDRHYELVDGLNILLIDPKVQVHKEFPQQIKGMKRSGAFMILHASEDYDKYGSRLEDLNDDLLTLTSYIVRHLCGA
ncbi:unnamed protein product [Caenorhabditis sp. 36 PRJEB53466]|nr:unnamed protein product [Caenorhabditis sp. 36 PRJEB53466]